RALPNLYREEATGELADAKPRHFYQILARRLEIPNTAAQGCAWSTSRHTTAGRVHVVARTEAVGQDQTAFGRSSAWLTVRVVSTAFGFFRWRKPTATTER